MLFAGVMQTENMILKFIGQIGCPPSFLCYLPELFAHGLLAHAQEVCQAWVRKVKKKLEVRRHSQ